MSWDNIVTWILRYWIGGMFTLLFIDGINNILSKVASHERFNNMDRLYLFLLWPLMLTVWIYTFIKSRKNRNK